MRFIAPSTATKSPQRRLQEGQAIVLIALLMLVLFAMLGLSIDSGRAYVDRRDLQAAVDAAALAAGDWYENYAQLQGGSGALPKAKAVFEADLHQYSGPISDICLPCPSYIGPLGNLRQDTDTVVYPDNETLTIVATNTQFNGYQFVFNVTHQLPLAFMQIFGGPSTATITASATSIVGNQRQTPALLTLSSDRCAMNLTGSAQLTVLGDVYSNGTACVDTNLHEAGNCYGAAGSTCDQAAYYCYNATAGFVPYAPYTNGGNPCRAGDILGGPVVPAPTLPDPGYLAPTAVSDCGGGPCYPFGQGYSNGNRGSWTEMYPGFYGNFHLSGSNGCIFLDGGVYTWTNGYQSDASRTLVSNELKAPDEEYVDPVTGAGPGTTNVANPQFWDQNAANCAGHFTVTNSAAQAIILGPACTDLSPQTPAVCHSGASDTLSRNNKWGVEVTSVRFDQFVDPAIAPASCLPGPGCRRESAPSECQLTPNPVVGGLHSPSNIGISVDITYNAPGAQYYNVYVNPSGCDGNNNNFGWVARFDAPGFSGGVPIGPFPNGTPWTLGALSAAVAPAAGASVYDLNDRMIPNPSALCYAQTRSLNCAPPDDEQAPQCFSNCPPPSNLLSQENPPMQLQYPPYTGGDVANENYCVISPNPGDPIAPCSTAKITPGAVQFYLPAGSCFSQNAQGATYVFAGEQYNWIVIYSPPGNTCNNTMNGGASTQYIGTIYTPGANWTINGGDRSPLAGQVICYTASVSGSGAAGIDFNPNYSPAPPAARLIN
jgi:hypothetical protein